MTKHSVNWLKILSLALILFPVIAFADENKYALIIGNDSYMGDFKPLPTCVNDAREMDKCLTALGYQTTTILNATREQIMTALDRFETDTKQKASIGVFFYSGHAVTINGEPYLIPAHTQIRKDNGRLKEYCVGINSIGQLMKNRCDKSILFLDACRNIVHGNTKGVSGSWEMPDIKSRSKGAQQVICFATALDDVARPGNERLSPFTQVLTSHIFDNESFQSVWNDYIESEVFALSNQHPTWEGTFSNAFYFNPNGIIRPSDSVSGGNSPSSNNKRSITINVIPNSATIRFGDSEYKSGKPLLYEIGSTYTYTIVEDGYLPYSGVLKISDTTPSNVDVRLTKIEKASIKIECNKYASVYLDDQYVGQSPCVINTTSGQHKLHVSKNGYLPFSTKLDLSSGDNRPCQVQLTHVTPKYWEWDSDFDGSQYLSYHFSPKYQIGLSYLYRPEGSRFSYGLYLSSSVGLFKGINMASAYSYAFVGTDFTYSVDENGTIVKYQESTSMVSSKPIDKYSEDIDPEHQAKKYDSNALMLANVGFNPCNGLLFEVGLGAGFHQDKYYLPYTSYKTQTITKNLNTGEIVGEPKYDYIKGDGDKWFKQNSKWSPALRLGTKALIPLDSWEKYFITIGGGYTFQFMNMKYSSWDATVGISWYF